MDLVYLEKLATAIKVVDDTPNAYYPEHCRLHDVFLAKHNHGVIEVYTGFGDHKYTLRQVTYGNYNHLIVAITNSEPAKMRQYGIMDGSKQISDRDVLRHGSKIQSALQMLLQPSHPFESHLWTDTVTVLLCKQKFVSFHTYGDESTKARAQYLETLFPLNMIDVSGPLPGYAKIGGKVCRLSYVNGISPIYSNESDKANSQFLKRLKVYWELPVTYNQIQSQKLYFMSAYKLAHAREKQLLKELISVKQDRQVEPTPKQAPQPDMKDIVATLVDQGVFNDIYNLKDLYLPDAK